MKKAAKSPVSVALVRTAMRALADGVRINLGHVRERSPRSSLADLDRVPTPLLLAAGLIPAAALAWLALQSPITTLLVLALIPAAAVWQGRRVRVVWERGIPAEIEELPPVQHRPVVPEPVTEPEGPPASRPPYAVQDPLIEMVEISGGSFWMGSDKALDPQAYGDELPRRQLRVRPFAIARTPITRGLYRSVRRDVPGAWAGDKDDDALPANHVSWKYALRFCNALSERSGRTPCYRKSNQAWECDWDADGYRLPTEAEWEYACRAGTETPWFWGAEEKDAGRHAWFADNAGYEVHPVGEKAANPWGLYDMAGNVREWCWDWHAQTYDSEDLDNPHGPAEGEVRVLRGGSFLNLPRDLRSAVRDRVEPEGRIAYIGFRCVRGSGRQLGH